MLKTSTRNVAYEVISCLIDGNGKGVLTEIIKFLTSTNRYQIEENGSLFLDNVSKRTMYGKNSRLSGHKIKRQEESEHEETEEFLNSSQRQVSSISVGSTTGSQGSSDIRIKIRKTSMEPARVI